MIFHWLTKNTFLGNLVTGLNVLCGVSPEFMHGHEKEMTCMIIIQPDTDYTTLGIIYHVSYNFHHWCLNTDVLIIVGVVNNYNNNVHYMYNIMGLCKMDDYCKRYVYAKF